MLKASSWLLIFRCHFMFMVLFVGILPVSARFNDKGTLRRARQIATGCMHVRRTKKLMVYQQSNTDVQLLVGTPELLSNEFCGVFPRVSSEPQNEIHRVINLLEFVLSRPYIY